MLCQILYGKLFGSIHPKGSRSETTETKVHVVIQPFLMTLDKFEVLQCLNVMWRELARENPPTTVQPRSSNTPLLRSEDDECGEKQAPLCLRSRFCLQVWDNQPQRGKNIVRLPILEFIVNITLYNTRLNSKKRHGSYSR